MLTYVYNDLLIFSPDYRNVFHGRNQTIDPENIISRTNLTHCKSFMPLAELLYFYITDMNCKMSESCLQIALFACDLQLESKFLLISAFEPLLRNSQERICKTRFYHQENTPMKLTKTSASW